MPDRDNRFDVVITLMLLATFIFMVIASCGHKRQLAEKNAQIRELQRK
jgi:hypothetical protein